jgi:glucosyl-dolichyl phosphate glucuronosyltransferase
MFSKIRNDPLFVSIVVCTFNRRHLLEEALNSILAMDYPKSSYEIIVVDGGSHDGTEALCKRFANVRFAVENRFGLAFARNRGTELACGAIIAFTDDDCIVDKQWLKNLVAGFLLSETVKGVGGPVYPLHPEIIPHQILVLPALGLYYAGEETKVVPGVITANAAFKRKVFEHIQFDETIGASKKGKLILTGEDVDFCQRFVEAGNKLLYVPDAKVYHQVNKERLSVAYVMKHAFCNGISTTKIILKRKNPRIWAVRVAMGQIMRALFALSYDKSFTSCYNLVHGGSTLLMSLTSLDEVLVPKSRIMQKKNNILVSEDFHLSNSL